MRRLRRFLRHLSATIVALATLVGCASTLETAEPGERLELLTHAEFVARESGRTFAIDPQVFAVAPGAAAAGLDDITHVDGLRNAAPADPLATRLFSATGKPLELTVGQWFFASGTVTLQPSVDGAQRVVATLRGLRPAGVYSLFDRRGDGDVVDFAPLDGTGASNTFVADARGAATVAVVAPRGLTHADAVVLVYHSDGEAHGASRGTPGVDAHHQLIVRVP